MTTTMTRCAARRRLFGYPCLKSSFPHTPPPCPPPRRRSCACASGCARVSRFRWCRGRWCRKLPGVLSCAATMYCASPRSVGISSHRLSSSPSPPHPHLYPHPQATTLSIVALEQLPFSWQMDEARAAPPFPRVERALFNSQPLRSLVTGVAPQLLATIFSGWGGGDDC